MPLMLQLFKGEVWVFCTSSLIIKVFLIISNILQLYYDNQHSPESWSSLLLSQLAENNRGACALRQSKNTINTCFRRRETRRMFSCVLSCANSKTRSLTWTYNTERAVCFMKQLKELLLGYISLFSFMFWCQNINMRQVTHLLNERLLYFWTDCLSAHTHLSFSASGDVSNELQLSELRRLS